jgi:hypothetical protein
MVRNYKINVKNFNKYILHYSEDYKKWIAPYFIEKTRSIILPLISSQKMTVYIDIANANSPAPEIYSKLARCKTYRQDLIYPEGLHGDVIGGDAAKMPLPNGFASAMALHCSFEYFEGDSDQEFIREESRVFRSGGRLCIVPLYLFPEYAIQTDPEEYLDFSPSWDKS